MRLNDSSISVKNLSMANISLSTPVPTHGPSGAVFLQTKLAQGIAGTFVWIALFLTCQQVCTLFLFSSIDLNGSLHDVFVICLVIT